MIKRRIRVRAFIDHEFCIVAADLPGCCSQGNSWDQAIDRFVEAATGVVGSYLADGMEPPWLLLTERPQRPRFREEVHVVIEVPSDA